MTLRPVETPLVIGVKRGPEYKVGPKCANPTCKRFADDPHHIFSRRMLGGAYRWVQLEGRLVGNLTGLCRPCHDDITGKVGGHKAAIRYHQGLFWWALVNPFRDSDFEYLLVDPIVPQPPTPETLEAQSESLPEEKECPFCGQARRRPKARSGSLGRRRKSWIVKVPDDEQENGAEVLDTLVENLALVIPNADSSMTGRYYVLVPTLTFATLNVDQLVAEFTGVGG